jgi:drug/metabolite transporter (DMT)-like permease
MAVPPRESRPGDPAGSEAGATVLGSLAILFWGSTVAFSRSLTEELGTLTAATWVFVLSGLVACAPLSWSRRRRRALWRLPRAYWIGCGATFVSYMVALYLGVGLARGRQQVVEVGMINYLWPSLTLCFAIPILRKRARWSLWPGVAIACLGVAIAMLQGDRWTWESFAASLRGNRVPYLLALAAAVSWALYSNFSRAWAGGREGNGVPVFLLATGCVLAAARLLHPEASRWTPRAALELAYMAVFPTLLAYLFWDTAMRRGHVVLVASLGYGTPLLSTLLSCVYLDVPLGLRLCLGCILVVAGAALCSRSLVDRESERSRA